MTQYCWFSIMLLSDMREDAYNFICKKYSYARYKLMKRLLSFKNDLVISTLGWKCLIYRIIFFLMNTFWSHINYSFTVYMINTQNKWKTTSLYYTLYHPTGTHSAWTIIQYKITQCKKHDWCETTRILYIYVSPWLKPTSLSLKKIIITNLSEIHLPIKWFINGINYMTGIFWYSYANSERSEL